MKAKQMPIVSVERARGLVLVTFNVTSIDEENFVDVVEQWEEIARSPNPQSVVIDLTGVRRIDAIGLLILQSLRDGIKEVGGTAVFNGPIDELERAAAEIQLARGTDTRYPSYRAAPSTQW